MRQIITTDEFFDRYEETNLNYMQSIVDNFIYSMKNINLGFTHLTGSDWVIVLLHDYKVEIDEEMGLYGTVSFMPNELADPILKTSIFNFKKERE
jgi:hypothetical protein